MRSVHVSISGRVQGVGFRAWTHEQARQLDLSGWVRNRRDGTVEALLSGGEDSVSEMIIRLQSGPLSARVERVLETDWNEEVSKDFRELPTA